MGILEIPKSLLIQNSESPLLSLVNFVYPEFILNMMSLRFFDDGAILCPKIEFVVHVNDFILSFISGEEITYLCLDTPYQSDED